MRVWLAVFMKMNALNTYVKLNENIKWQKGAFTAGFRELGVNVIIYPL